MPQIFKYDKPFTLESGKTLPGFQLAYTALGTLNEAADNVVWVFHALTANSDPSEWWFGLLGEGKMFDPATAYIVCVNMPGSCYGSISPLDISAESGEPWYHLFPWFTIRDMIRSYQLLRVFLGIQKINVGLGGSMGGQQLLEWAVEEPGLFNHIVPLATNAIHSPWGIAFNASQRWCITSDPSWQTNDPAAGLGGMKVARSLALISYRNYNTYHHAQQSITSDTVDLPVDEQVFRAETYQHYQGHKLALRFNAFSYYFLSKGMDAHNLARGRETLEAALGTITAKALVIGIKTDLLFPVREQQFIAEHINDGQFVLIDSQYGHDGFLLEFEKITRHLKTFLTPELIEVKEAAQLNGHA
jgi:homoserine O-acetyltransferase